MAYLLPSHAIIHCKLIHFIIILSNSIFSLGIINLNVLYIGNMTFYNVEILLVTLTFITT